MGEYVRLIYNDASTWPSLTTAEKANYYTAIRILFGDLSTATAYDQEVTTAQATEIATALADTTNIAAIAALDGNSWTTTEQYSDAASLEFREYMIGQTNNYVAWFYSERSNIADALELSASTKTSFVDAAETGKTLADTWKARLQSEEDSYNASSVLSYGMALVAALVAKILLE